MSHSQQQWLHDYVIMSLWKVLSNTISDGKGVGKETMQYDEPSWA